MTLQKTNIPEKKIIDIARVERNTALADGLFLPVHIKGEKRLSMKHHVPFKLKGVEAIAEWRGIQLDATDLNVFLALSRLASVDSNREVRQINTCKDKLKDAMKFEGEKANTNANFFFVRTSVNEIVAESGYQKCGKNHKAVYESIMRLCSLRLNIIRPEDVNKAFPPLVLGANLFGNLSIKENQIVISYHPQVMAMLNGSIDGCLIDMSTMKEIKSDVGKKMMFWLSAWASHDRYQKIFLDTLATHVWSEEAKTPELKWKRRHQLKKELTNLSGKGWDVKIDEGLCEIKRPKL